MFTWQQLLQLSQRIISGYLIIIVIVIIPSYVQSACKLFKAAEESRLDRDEEKSYVLYMKYLTVYDIIKKRQDFRNQQVWLGTVKMWCHFLFNMLILSLIVFLSFYCSKDYYLTLLGQNSFKKAIEEAEKLSESLKLRFEDSSMIVSRATCSQRYCRFLHVTFLLSVFILLSLYFEQV